MATTSLNSNVTGQCITGQCITGQCITGQCIIDFNHDGHTYPDVHLGVLKDLCCDTISTFPTNNQSLY